MSCHANVDKTNWCSIAESRYAQKNSMSSLLLHQLSSRFSEQFPLIENVLLLLRLLSKFFLQIPMIENGEHKRCSVGKRRVTIFAKSRLLRQNPSVDGKGQAKPVKQG